MGGKKQGVKILAGSLKTHWMKYINEVNINVNPTDKHGMGMATAMVRTVYTLDTKFVQPGFKFNHNMMMSQGYYDPSIMQLKFINGYERSYNMAASTI